MGHFLPLRDIRGKTIFLRGSFSLFPSVSLTLVYRHICHFIRARGSIETPTQGPFFILLFFFFYFVFILLVFSDPRERRRRVNLNAPRLLSLRQFQLPEVAFLCLHITLKPPLWIKGRQINNSAAGMTPEAINVYTLK